MAINFSTTIKMTMPAWPDDGANWQEQPQTSNVNGDVGSPRLYSSGRFADYLAVDVETVADWIKEGMPVVQGSETKGIPYQINANDAFPWVVDRLLEGGLRDLKRNYYSIDTVADLLGISPETIYECIAEGMPYKEYPVVSVGLFSRRPDYRGKRVKKINLRYALPFVIAHIRKKAEEDGLAKAKVQMDFHQSVLPKADRDVAAYSIADIAELLGVPPGRVSEYIKKGMPAEVDHANAEQTKIYLNKALPWVIQHIRGGADANGAQERLWEAKAQHQELVNEQLRAKEGLDLEYVSTKDRRPKINALLSDDDFHDILNRGLRIRIRSQSGHGLLIGNALFPEASSVHLRRT